MTKDRNAAPSAKLNEAAAPPSASTTKAATVLALLKREQGSTLAELVEATAWQPHTARAMLTAVTNIEPTMTSPSAVWATM